jgi:histidyl-tRNA synthetase
VFVALDKRGKVEDGEIEALLAAAGLDAAAIGRVLELTRIGALDEAAARLPADCPALAEAREFQRLAAAYGLDELLVFDIGIIRGLSYYTGIVFEAFDTERKFRAIFGGGRYDNLLSDIGGQPATAVGLGFGDVVIAEILAEKGLDGPACGPAAVAVGYMDPGQRAAAAAMAMSLRRAGCPADMAIAPEKPKKFFARAGKGDFAEAAFIGPDDAAAGTVRIKNLATRAERTVPIPRTDGPAT